MPGYDDHARERFSGATTEDYRGTYARDRDRVLYSSAFRRLSGKTQVVAAGEAGDFHNRMTHSLKVAQLGRRLGEKLRAQALEAGLFAGNNVHPGPDPELIEAACLAHDLGHPPFGHAGEQALMHAYDELAHDLEHQRRPTAEIWRSGKPRVPVRSLNALVPGGFEGNAQTFRILVRLCARPPVRSRGLDLSRGTLAATIKYPWNRGTEGVAVRKWNAYPDDEEAARWVRDDAWGPGEAKTFEAAVMDWCDDVTYACHDVEDFYRAGIIPLDRLFDFPPLQPGAEPEDEPEEARGFFDFLERDWGDKFDRAQARAEWRALSQLISITEPFGHSRVSKVALHRSTSRLISYFIDAVRWNEGGEPCLYGASLEVDPAARLRCDMLQKLIWYYVIGRPALASQQTGQQRIVRELLRIYVLGGDEERLLPADRLEELEEGTPLLRVATDHVASLTEPTALALHQRLTGVRSGLHSDPYWKA